MFDMSWGEVLVIGAGALIVIGPKDLPKALRTLGQMTSKVRRMASEFQTQFNDAMREAELDDVKKDLQGMTSQVSSFNPLQTVRDELKNAIEAKPSAAAAEPSRPAEPELPLPPPAPDPYLPPPEPAAPSVPPEIPAEAPVGAPPQTPVEAPAEPPVTPPARSASA